MANKQKTISVTWHQPSKQFKKTIGKHRGRDGRIQPKTWYLGGDERLAVERAIELTAQWNTLKRSGVALWPTETQTPENTHEEIVVEVDALTVDDMANLYLGEILARAEIGQVSWSHYRTTMQRMQWVLRAIGGHRRFSEIGERELRDATLFLGKRPLTRLRPHQTQPCKPMSTVSVKAIINLMRSLCVFAEETTDGGWRRPARFNRIVKLKPERMATVADRRRAAPMVKTREVSHFTIEELSLIWKSASERERLYLLLGLNCGFTSNDISELRTFETRLEGDQPLIHRMRPKTGVEAKWSLWPETTAMLLKHHAPQNPDQRVVMTTRNNKLVSVTRSWRRDAINQVWLPLVKSTDGVRPLGFRFLRKTSADAMKRIGGLEVSEMFLAHQEPGLNKAYANRDWPRMHRALCEYRNTLTFLKQDEERTLNANAPS